MILSIRRNRGCSGGFLDFRNRAAIPPARMVVIQPGMAINKSSNGARYQDIGISRRDSGSRLDTSVRRSCAVGSKIGPRWVGLLPTAGSDLAVRPCHQIIWIWAIPSPAE